MYVLDIIEGVIVVILYINQAFPQWTLSLLTSWGGLIEDVDSDSLKFVWGTWRLYVLTEPVVERAASIDSL